MNNHTVTMKEAEQIIRQYSDMIYRIAVHNLGNIADAEDILQEVCISLLTKCPKQLDSEHLKAWLEKFGMEVHDKTPYVGGVRGDDITAWFNRHPGEYSYVILDDDDDMDGHMEHLVQTEFDAGLTEEKADECIRLLREQ